MERGGGGFRGRGGPGRGGPPRGRGFVTDRGGRYLQRNEYLINLA